MPHNLFNRTLGLKLPRQDNPPSQKLRATWDRNSNSQSRDVNSTLGDTLPPFPIPWCEVQRLISLPKVTQ